MFSAERILKLRDAIFFLASAFAATTGLAQTLPGAATNMARPAPPNANVEAAPHSPASRHENDLNLTAASDPVDFDEVAWQARVDGPSEGDDHGSAWADFNNDGLMDIIYTSKEERNYLYLNNGNGTFAEVAEQAGLNSRAHERIRGVTVADYDNDGDTDIFFCAGFKDALYRNDGDLIFADVTDDAGVGNRGNGLIGSWGDYNRDGYIDLYVANWNEDQHALYRNNGDGTFSEVTQSAGLGYDNYNNIGQWFDYDNDGDMDIFSCRWYDNPQRLWRNNGNGTFTDVAPEAGLGVKFSTQGSIIADFNNDGFQDIYIASDLDPNVLFRNNGNGTFTEVAGEVGVANYRRAVDCAYGDFNHDGWMDLYVGNFDSPNRLYLNNGDGSFEDDSGVTADYARTIGASTGDYNGDGWLDMYAVNTSATNRLYRNKGTNSHWLKVELRGVQSNRSAIGTRLELLVNGMTIIREVSGGSGYCSQNSLIQSFGLGPYASAERLTIRWSSGVVDILNNVAANNMITITESQAQKPDKEPPVISTVRTANVSGASATITWQTDEPANSRVEYGLTSAYGNLSALDASLITHHSIGLTGLTKNTTYHYRVRSRDAAGNLAMSRNFTFTTNDQTVLFSDDFSGPNLNTGKWNKGSNSGNQTAIENGALTLRSSASQSGWIATKTAYAGANKIAKVKIVKPNDDGNIGMSPTVNRAGADGFYGQKNWYRFYVYRNGHAGKYLLFAQWRRNGVAGGLNVTNGLTLPNSFYLRLRTDAANIFFEYSPDEVSWTTVHQETFALPGYSLSGNFYFEISGNNTPSNGILKADDFALLETTPGLDTQPPVISAVAAANITSTSAQITWKTDEAGDSQVQYGLTTGYGSQSPLQATSVTAHSVTLNNLNANTTYHYRVKSKDATGNLAVSSDFTFATSAAGSPLFSDGFNTGTIDLKKWVKGTNSGNQTSVVNKALELRSNGAQSGWILTKQAYAGRNTTIGVKVMQPNDDGDLGMSPTYGAASTTGIYNQKNWYRFYTYREGAGNYRLFAQWKKNGVEGGLEVTGNMSIAGAVYLRLRLDNSRIHFEASFNGQSWKDTYNEVFALPGYTLDSKFYYELSASRTATKGALRVDDFSITSASVVAKRADDSASAQVAEVAVPAAFGLGNYPNPFNISTRVSFDLPQAAEIDLTVFDLVGQHVQKLEEGRFEAGRHEARWHGRNKAGVELSTGTYLIRLQYRVENSNEAGQMVRRVMLLK